MILILQIAAGVIIANIIGASISVVLQKNHNRRRNKAIADEILKNLKEEAAAKKAAEVKGGQYL